jgi:NADH pyrophosphatase NudC (nudix superfamily)
VEIGAIILLLALLILVALFVSQPFTSRWSVKGQSSHEISALLAERERALTALMELDFDNGIGKIPAEEYSTQRASLIQKGSDILRQLDAIQGTQTFHKDKSFESMAGVQKDAQLSDEDLEELIAKRRTNHQQKTAGFCPKCGKPILQSDKFCPSCGQPVNS